MAPVRGFLILAALALVAGCAAYEDETQAVEPITTHDARLDYGKAGASTNYRGAFDAQYRGGVSGVGKCANAHGVLQNGTSYCIGY